MVMKVEKSGGIKKLAELLIRLMRLFVTINVNRMLSVFGE